MCKHNVPIDAYRSRLLPLAIRPTQLHLDLVTFLPICRTLDVQPNHWFHSSPEIFTLNQNKVINRKAEMTNKFIMFSLIYQLHALKLLQSSCSFSDN